MDGALCLCTRRALVSVKLLVREEVNISLSGLFMSRF